MKKGDRHKWSYITASAVDGHTSSKDGKLFKMQITSNLEILSDFSCLALGNIPSSNAGVGDPNFGSYHCWSHFSKIADMVSISLLKCYLGRTPFLTTLFCFCGTSLKCKACRNCCTFWFGWYLSSIGLWIGLSRGRKLAWFHRGLDSKFVLSGFLISSWFVLWKQ